MKLLVAVIFAFLAISTYANEDNWEIDWSTVMPLTETPGFWDGRDIKPAFYPGDMTRTGRIVGGMYNCGPPLDSIPSRASDAHQSSRHWTLRRFHRYPASYSYRSSLPREHSKHTGRSWCTQHQSGNRLRMGPYQ